MTISELRPLALDGQWFAALTRNGRRLLCRWVDVQWGLFNVEEADGRRLREKCICDLRGAPDAPVVEYEYPG